MDICSEYYIETEGGEYIGNIISSTVSISLDQYVDRFEDLTAGEEYWCVECGAYPVEDINFAYDCEMPVQCFVDPCMTVDCADGYECLSEYCGGSYGDCILSEEEDWVDFTNIDFGRKFINQIKFNLFVFKFSGNRRKNKGWIIIYQNVLIPI